MILYRSLVWNKFTNICGLNVRHHFQMILRHLNKQPSFVAILSYRESDVLTAPVAADQQIRKLQLTFTKLILKIFGFNLVNLNVRQRNLTRTQKYERKKDGFGNPHFGPAGRGWKLCVSVQNILLIPTGVMHQQTNVI